MNRKLLVVIVSAILMMAVVLGGRGGGLVSAICGLFLVFVLPGYTLVKLLFPENDLETAEFVALTLGLSLAIAALGGLVIHWLPWKLDTHSWTVFLGSIAFFAGILALLREQSSKTRPASFVRVKVSLSLNDGLLFMLAGVGVALAFGLAYSGEVIQHRSDFTQLWIVPGKEADSPIQIGINNHAAETIQYRLLVKGNGEIIDEIPLIELKPEETWENSFSLPEYVDSITAELYRLYIPAEACAGENLPDLCQRNNEIYREVVLRK